LLAAGACPAPLGFSGEEHLVTNEEFLEMDKLPARIALVGGGYIAAEFSHIAARAGAKVTILQRGDRMLTHFDPDVVGWLMESFREVGIDVRTGHSVDAVEKKSDGFVVRARSKDGRQTKAEADLVVHAAGRIPDLEFLDLDTAGVERDERGHLKLNEFLQSVSNPAVYAAGDAAQVGPPLTPVSGHDEGHHGQSPGG
jgi:glutathione reductase (NADPH)